MQRTKLDATSTAAAQQQAQEELADEQTRARLAVLSNVVAFGAIVLALRVGKRRITCIR